MPKVSTSADAQLIKHPIQLEMENFMLQDEQEILQYLEQELDQLIQEPSASSIDKILDYANLR